MPEHNKRYLSDSFHGINSMVKYQMVTYLYMVSTVLTHYSTAVMKGITLRHAPVVGIYVTFYFKEIV